MEICGANFPEINQFYSNILRESGSCKRNCRGKSGDDME